MFRTLEISASGMVAQRTRMDTIAGNIAHVNTSLDEHGDKAPFMRRMVVMQPEANLPGSPTAPGQAPRSDGVRAEVKIDDATPVRKVHDPGHPHADTQGYVSYPNINLVTEFVNALEAGRAYDANVTAMEMSQQMLQATFKILS